MNYRFLVALFSLFITILSSGNSAFAQSVGIAEPWQIDFQRAVSPAMERLVALNDYLNIVIIAITVFVLALLAYACIRFREKRNPVPSKTSHHTLLEIVWTTLPILILLTIAVPSFRLLYFMDKAPDPEMTLKVIGHQWYWEYQYPDHGDINFDSNMIKDNELKEGQHRLLEVDNRVILPVDTTIQILITSADVMHAWAMPSMGIKTDAVPGRLNQAWVRITEPGIYYGQCSELCGIYHGFMPIAIEAVSKEEFKTWVERKRASANSNTPSLQLYASNITE